MKHFGLIGHPLGHSLSKAYFSDKFEKEKIDTRYDLFDLESINVFPRFLSEHPDLCGFNVTIPYKEAIIPYLDTLDPEAEAIGAVNTVKVLPDGKLKGFNTDVLGVEATLTGCLRGAPTALRNPLRELLRCLLGHLAKPYSALILGTGGASKAVQYVLKKHNIPFHLVSRTPHKGHFTYETLTPEIINEHLLIINATPVGMAPHINDFPPIPYEAITSEHVLFDLVYNPEETLFLCNGRQHGANTINGLTMLYAQADASWNIWNQ